VLQGYGMTELSPVTHVIPMDGQSKPGSIGPSVPNTESRIVDTESGEDVPTGERGELWIRGPQVMKGYLNNDEATRETVDDDGWLHTGDVAIADDDGYLTIVDRVKELIKYKGFQVAPAELEALLITHPAVADAAVIPVADEEAGELPKAFCVLSGEVTPDEIMEFVGGKVSSYKRVRLVRSSTRSPSRPRARSCAGCSSTASAPPPADPPMSSGAPRRQGDGGDIHTINPGDIPDARLGRRVQSAQHADARPPAPPSGHRPCGRGRTPACGPVGPGGGRRRRAARPRAAVRAGRRRPDRRRARRPAAPLLAAARPRRGRRRGARRAARPRIGPAAELTEALERAASADLGWAAPASASRPRRSPGTSSCSG
jgi:hypothetical protein